MDSLPIINKTYEIYKIVVIINEKLERRKRYSIGMSLEESIIHCMENLIMAKNAPKPLKSAYLIRASSQLEIATLKLRLYLELQLANETRIFQTQAQCAEIGRMLGGWMKANQSS